jgi:hypothetical protein
VRILAFIAAIAGVAGAALIVYSAGRNIKQFEAEYESSKHNPDPEVADHFRREAEKFGHAKRAFFGSIGALPLGVLGGFFILRRYGKLAAVFLLAAYSLPIVMWSLGAKIDFTNVDVRTLFAVPAGFAIAGILSLFVKRSTPYKKPKRGDYIPEDTDMVG